MDNQDAVTQPAEQTAPTESAPVETETADASPTSTEEGQPADATVEPKKVSESVPYERFHEVNSEKQRLAEEIEWLKSQIQAPAPSQGVDIPELDEVSARAVDFRVQQAIARDRTNQFLARHQEELKDDILSGTLGRLINKAEASGRPVDHEALLQQAKSMLDERVKPVIKEAKQEAFKEGHEIAKAKEQSGAVGTSSYKEPEVDDSQLSAAELAKKYNLPRI